MTVYLTRRGENALRAAAVTSVLLISGTGMVLLSAIGEDRRCAHLTSTPHAAADTYGCDSTTTGTAGAGEGPAVPVVTRSTAVVVAPQPKPSKASRKRTALPAASGSLNWTALAQCESSGNPRAVSRTGRHRGAYQFTLSSWHWVGMTGDPIDASLAVQTEAAVRLLAKQGRNAWPYCGRFL